MKNSGEDINAHLETNIKNEPIFNLPISYLSDKQIIAEHIKSDLELTKNSNNLNKNEESDKETIYDTVFKPNTIYGKQTTPLWSNYYTSNKDFIKDSQVLLKNINPSMKKPSHIQFTNNVNSEQQEEVDGIWKEIKTETGFIEKYHYIDWKKFRHFNNSSGFLQLLSLYNMTSPLLSLSIPIFFLILPFIILKLQGIPISISKYIETLTIIFKQHQIGQLFALGSASWDKVIYILFSFGFYVLQVYQNITSCIKYYYNMKKIHSQLFSMREYVTNTIKNIDYLTNLAKTNKLTTYEPFFDDMINHRNTLQYMEKEFSQIVPNGFTIKKIKQIGHVMKCFYQLYNKKEYHETLEYSFGLNGYIDNLLSLSKRYNKKQVNKCKINHNVNNKVKRTKFTGAYFPTLIDASPVKNSYTLNKHILITGPNAAGKTTLLKTTIFNIIFSQQTGVGFYKSANLTLYDYIHCYINIPDTSARDSLFQAEARRCKDIIDIIEDKDMNNREKNHLCVFDELYSGTNPYEAIGSAYAFLSYLNKYENVNFVLTTHFLDLCKRMESQKSIQNYHMQVEENGEDFKYTYKMKKNISTVKGGVKVLRDLKYPKEIIENTRSILQEITL